MSLDLTNNFLTAAARRGVQPIWLVELPGLYRFFATTEPDHSENVWRFGDGIVLGAGAVFGGKRPASDVRLESGAHLAGIRRALTESGNADRLSRTQVTLLNQDRFSDYVTVQQFDNAKVRILLGFDGLAYADFALLMAGRVDNYEQTWESFTLDITDARYQLHRDLSARLGDVFFSGAPSSSRGRAVPMLIGRVEDHDLLQVEGDASGTLAFAIETFHTYIRLNESTAGFPESGTIDLGTTAETGVPYSGRRLVVIQGQTYLQLENLVRTSPVAHNAGVAVDLANPTDAYLVAYQSGAVTAVYDDDGVISTAEYTVEHNASGADYPVTLVRFSTAPNGSVSADVDGPDADPPAELTNGDFETGNLTGWTASGGATASASTSDPAEGTYHLDLEGGDDTYEDLYQSVSTRRGRYYNLNVLYKDNDVGVNLLTNGSFETDATTGWTESENDNAALSLHTGFPAHPDYGVVPHGSNALQIAYNGQAQSLGERVFTYSFYQDITTVVSSGYTFSFMHFASAFSPFRSQNGEYGILNWVTSVSSPPGNPAIGPFYFIVQVGYKLATHDDATIYEDVWLPAVNYGRSFQRIDPVFFTAVSTTTRVLVRVTSVTGQFVQPPRPVYLDKIHLEETTDVKTSYSRVQVGTASDPSSALDAELEQSFNWREVDLSFKAPAANTRITLSSKWTGAAASSFFDDVHVQDAGRNPAQVIADLIDRFLPAWGRDTASFDVAAEQLTGWQFQGVISDPGASKTLLENLAFECKSSILEGANDKLKMVVDEPSATTTMEFTTDNIDENTLKTRGDSLEDRYTDFRLTFGENSQIVEATPDGTTHPSEALDELCAVGESLFGFRREYTRTLSYIQDVDTAHHLLSYLVYRHAQRQQLLTFRTQDYRAVQLERGDTVGLTHPVTGLGKRQRAKVLEHDIKLDGVHLKLRSWGDANIELSDLPELLPPITSGLRLWLRADDLAATYNDDDRIESWFDAYLGTIEFTSTGLNRPTFKENILNGHAVARFSSTTQSEEVSVAPNPLADMSGGTACTIFIVTRLDAEQSGVTWIYSWDSPASGMRVSKFLSTDHKTYIQFKSNSQGFAYGGPRLDDDIPHLLVCHFDGSVPEAGIFIDGGENEVETFDPVTQMFWESDFLVIGSGAASNAVNGDIAEIMIYERTMSRTERKSIELYLQTKYGLV